MRIACLIYTQRSGSIGRAHSIRQYNLCAGNQAFKIFQDFVYQFVFLRRVPVGNLSTAKDFDHPQAMYSVLLTVSNHNGRLDRHNITNRDISWPALCCIGKELCW